MKRALNDIRAMQDIGYLGKRKNLLCNSLGDIDNEGFEIKKRQMIAVIQQSVDQ